MRRVLVTLCIALVFLDVCYGRVDGKCKDGDPNCIDFDYHYEEAAKEMVVKNSNLFSFNILIKRKPTVKINLTRVTENENLKEWWIEWHQSPLQHRSPEKYVKPLCKPDKMEDIFIECGEVSSNTHACIGTKNGTIDQCERYADSQFLIPICKEGSSNKLVTCGELSTFLCYPFEENEPPIKPCHDPYRKICLSQNGSLEKCAQKVLLTNRRVGSLESIQSEEANEERNQWKLQTPKQEEMDSEMRSPPLCLLDEEKGELRYCNENEADSIACISFTAGEVAACKKFTDKEMVAPICSEISSSKVMICDKNVKKFLCFPTGDGIKPIQACDIESRQICLNDSGVLQKCNYSSPSDNSSRTSEMIANAINDYKIWDDWWGEWVADMPVTEEEKEVYLCKTDEESEKLTICDKLFLDEKACVSAKSGEIDICKKLDDSDLPVPLCTKGSMNKVISCKYYGSAFLCFPSDDKKKPIRPCRLENRHLCLTVEGSLEKCSVLKLSDATEVGDNTTFYEDDFLYWNRWWEEWFSISHELENYLSEGVPERLCQTKDESIFECLHGFSNNTICVGAKTGRVGVCEDMQINDLPIPICREGLTNKVITCGRHTHAFLCFTVSEKPSFMKPCLSIQRQTCLGTDGELELCNESATAFTLFENRKKGEKGNWNKAVWNNWWKEWKSGSMKDQSLNKTGISLCKRNSKKNRIAPCKENETETKLCVSARYWKISECEGYNDSDFPVPICSDNSSKRVMTCGNSTSASLCFKGRGRPDLIFPCKSPSLQICLSIKGFLKKCSEQSKAVKSSERDVSMPAEFIYGEDRRVEKMRNNEARYLCIDDNDDHISPCSTFFSHAPACLNTRKGTIETCEKIEKNSDIGLPVCIHVNTSKLLTCGKFSEGNLCFPRSRKMSPIKPCKRKTRNVCITKEGTLAKCARSLENATDYYDRDRESNVLIRMEYKYFEYEQKNVSSLCIQEDKNTLKECTTDPTVNFACLSSKKGIIHSCESAAEYNLSIPLCIQGLSKTVVTCGKFNNVNLCSHKDPSTLKPCKNESYFACFKNGLINRCQDSNVEYRNSDKYLNQNEDYQVSGYQNSREVYEFESNSIHAMLKNCSRLCELEGGANEIQPCEEDPSINFACLGVSEGAVRSCDAFSSTELVMPVCVEETRKVVTHGKFFRAYLCFEEKDDGVKIQACSIQSQLICLTKEGLLRKCDYDESKINSELLDGSEKEENASPEQSTTDSQSNANTEEDMTSNDYETMESDREEMSEDDSSEELNVVSRIKSSKKSSKKGKQDDNRKSAEKLRDKMKAHEKNSEREVTQSKKTKGRKYKSITKDYNENQNVKGVKKSKKSKSKPREERSIKEVIYRMGNIPKTGKIIDTDQYELRIPHEAAMVGGEHYADDYSEIKGEEMLFIDDSYYPERALEEYKAKIRETIREKELRLIANIHMESRHLCKQNSENEKLVNCDKDSQLNFACVGATEGNIRMCHEFEETDIAFPLCFQANSRNLVTCDIYSNVQLCMAEGDNATALTPCEVNNRHACLGDDDAPVECDKHAVRRATSMEQFTNPDPNDEKFFRIICTNCSLENTFYIEGTPDDIEPTLEIITYPTK